MAVRDVHRVSAERNPARREQLITRQNERGYWTGFQDGARDGDRYRYWVEGEGSTGYKRDPCARELDPNGFPNCFSILRDGNNFPWHDQDFVTPDFSDMKVGAGVGLRYITPFGPLRIDAALPLNRERGDPRFGIYAGIGQAF